MKIVLEGKPIAKMRARYSKRGNFVITYDPQSEAKESVRQRFILALHEALNQESKEECLEAYGITHAKAFEVDFWFYMPINESDSETTKNAKLWGFELPTSKPDYDNMEKFYLDCANGVFWPDDRMIIDAHAHKRYDVKPRMEVTIVERKEMKLPCKAESVIKVFSPDMFKNFLIDVRKFDALDPIALDGPRDENFEDWLTMAACLVSEFSSKYATTLKKVQAKAGGDITHDTLELQQCKAALHRGDYDCREAKT